MIAAVAGIEIYYSRRNLGQLGYECIFGGSNATPVKSTVGSTLTRHFFPTIKALRRYL